MLDFDFYITTPRLAITYFNPNQESHVDFMMRLYGAEEIAASTDSFSMEPLTREGALKMINERAEQIETTGFGRYLVSLLPHPTNETNENQSQSKLDMVKAAQLIGLVSLNTRDGAKSSPIPDAGFRILSSQRGKGYATEALDGLLKYYAQEKQVLEVLAYCDPINEPSKAVLRKLGFQEESTVELEAHGLVMNLGQWSRGLKKGIKDYNQ
ncbi:acyl-CoA N-acyltransferase [Periconia macrospinosa]|uniref:Acyl-CoA N-acyltransferase n=1 Tax=Periconia macrospinosa TaxID=97972 RepID=A0A2V1DXS9_9PLEO|nr:acyl-CoA N-acyltransferase [Periconia macrospinosa]